MESVKSRQESYYLYKRARSLCYLYQKNRILIRCCLFVSENITHYVAYILLKKQFHKSSLPFLYLLKNFIKSGFSLPASIIEISSSSKYLFARYFKFLIKRFSKGRGFKKTFGIQSQFDWELLMGAHLKGLSVLPVLEKVIYFKELESKIEEKISTVKRSAYMQMLLVLVLPMGVLFVLYYFQSDIFRSDMFSFEMFFIGSCFFSLGFSVCSKSYPFYKKNSVATTLRALLKVLVEIQIYTLYGFDLKYSWRVVSSSYDSFCQDDLFVFCPSTNKISEIQTWGVLMRALYQKGLPIAEALEGFLMSMVHKVELECEIYQRTLPIKVNIFILIFYLPVVFLWVYYPLLKLFIF